MNLVDYLVLFAVIMIGAFLLKLGADTASWFRSRRLAKRSGSPGGDGGEDRNGCKGGESDMK